MALTIVGTGRQEGRGVAAISPSMAQNFLNFMLFSGKFGKILCWRSPTENPKSALAYEPFFFSNSRKREENPRHATVSN